MYARTTIVDSIIKDLVNVPTTRLLRTSSVFEFSDDDHKNSTNPVATLGYFCKLSKISSSTFLNTLYLYFIS